MSAFGGQRIKPVSDCVFGNLDKIEVDTTNDRGVKLDPQLITLKKNTKLIELISKVQITLVDGTSYHLSPNIGNNEDVKQAFLGKLQELARQLNSISLPCIKLSLNGIDEEYTYPRRVTKADVVEVMDVDGNLQPSLIIYISDESANSNRVQKYYLYQSYGFNYEHINYNVLVKGAMIDLNKHISKPFNFNRLTIVNCPPEENISSLASGGGGGNSLASGGGNNNFNDNDAIWRRYGYGGGKKKQRKTKRRRTIKRRKTHRRRHQ
jgi:hypothetical protein